MPSPRGSETSSATTGTISRTAAVVPFAVVFMVAPSVSSSGSPTLGIARVRVVCPWGDTGHLPQGGCGRMSGALPSGHGLAASVARGPRAARGVPLRRRPGAGLELRRLAALAARRARGGVHVASPRRPRPAAGGSAGRRRGGVRRPLARRAGRTGLVRDPARGLRPRQVRRRSRLRRRHGRRECGRARGRPPPAPGRRPARRGPAWLVRHCGRVGARPLDPVASRRDRGSGSPRGSARA